MTLIHKKSTVVTTNCSGKLLSWKERGILVGEIAVGVWGSREDERFCFAIEANHDVCLAGMTHFGSIYQELKLPVTPYLLEMKQGTVTFCKPVDTLAETVGVLERRLRNYLRRLLDEEDSFENLIEDLNSCRNQLIDRTAIEKRFRQALQLLEMAYEQRLKNRLRQYVPWQEIRAEIEGMCVGGNCFKEEIYFNDATVIVSAGG